jgi:hypothetical protein
LLAGAHVAGVQTAMLVSAITECTREAVHLAGAKDESDTPIHDGPAAIGQVKRNSANLPTGRHSSGG